MLEFDVSEKILMHIDMFLTNHNIVENQDLFLKNHNIIENQDYHFKLASSSIFKFPTQSGWFEKELSVPKIKAVGDWCLKPAWSVILLKRQILG